MRKPLIIGLTAAILGAGALGVSVAQADRDRGYGDHERCAEQRSGEADHMSFKHRMKADHGMTELTEQLNLSLEQRDQIEDLFAQQRSEIRQQMRTFRDLRSTLQRLDVAAADYDQQINALVSKSQADAEALIRMRSEQKKALYALLTPEQQTLFSQRHK